MQLPSEKRERLFCLEDGSGGPSTLFTIILKKNLCFSKKQKTKKTTNSSRHWRRSLYLRDEICPPSPPERASQLSNGAGQPSDSYCSWQGFPHTDCEAVGSCVLTYRGQHTWSFYMGCANWRDRVCKKMPKKHPYSPRSCITCWIWLWGIFSSPKFLLTKSRAKM